MVPRRSGEREPAAPGSLDRRTGRKQRRFVARLGADRVGVQPTTRCADTLDQLRGVTTQDVDLGGRCACDEGEMLVQDRDALLRLGM
jgi:hypothetical protein